MAADLIGRCRCWNEKCPAPNKARLSVSKSGLAVITCNGCQSQLFTRSEISDEGARYRHIPERAQELEPAPAIEQKPEHKPKPAPAPAPVIAAPPPAPVPAAAPRTKTWSPW